MVCLAQAKAAFFGTDQECSGAIDREELSLMLKNLGQNPTKARRIVPVALHHAATTAAAALCYIATHGYVHAHAHAQCTYCCTAHHARL